MGWDKREVSKCDVGEDSPMRRRCFVIGQSMAPEVIGHSDEENPVIQSEGVACGLCPPVNSI